MPAQWPDYELIDFGAGRKLERFGERVFDRPAPQSSETAKANPGVWKAAHWTFAGDRVGGGEWKPGPAAGGAAEATPLRCPLEEPTSPSAACFVLQIAPAPAGQVGVFPEQFENWRWIAAQVRRAAQPLRVLNLFGYTGGSTLAAAAAGAQVTHVDASRPAVAQARANAAASGLAEAPVRWIVEDAARYCQREVRRGARYDAVVLDPPSYGHGAKGEPWRLAGDLLPLLADIGKLVDKRPRFVLLTCHTPGVGPAELAAYLSEGIFGGCSQAPRSAAMQLVDSQRRALPSGLAASWP